jgi:hypothetical protein
MASAVQLRKGPVLVCLALALILAGLLLLISHNRTLPPDLAVETLTTVRVQPNPAAHLKSTANQHQQAALDQLASLENNTAALRLELAKLQGNHRDLVAANTALLSARADVNRQLALNKPSRNHVQQKSSRHAIPSLPRGAGAESVPKMAVLPELAVQPIAKASDNAGVREVGRNSCCPSHLDLSGVPRPA